MKKNIFLLFSLICTFALPLQISAEERPVTILYLGDSLTEGFGIEPEEAYPALVNTKLKEAGHLNIKTINGGYSGSTTASAFSRLKWYSRVKPDIVVLALGANDGLRGLPPEAMQTNLAKAIEFAQSKGIKVVLCGMQAPPNYGKEYTARFKEVYLTLTEEFGISLVPFLLNKVAGHPKMNLPDGIHPNQNGHRIIAETVYGHLFTVINSNRRNNKN